MTEQTQTPRRGRKAKNPTAPEKPKDVVDDSAASFSKEEVQAPMQISVPTPVGTVVTSMKVDDRKVSVMTHLTAARMSKLNMLELPSSNLEALSRMADAVIAACTKDD